jgi:Flp pilus assembly protein TadG
MAVELVLLTVPLVVILLFVVALGRLASARNQVEEAARDAARAASVAAGSPGAARQQALAAADADLSGLSCADRTVDVDTDALHPGGQVAVTVGCHVPLGDLVLFDTPGRRTVQATSVAVVDTYAEP